MLVTGCTGFLGFWLTRALLERQARVVGLVRDMVPDAPFFLDGLPARMITVRGGLDDLPLLERVIGEHEIDTVFHLAAQAIVGVANRNPVGTFETNIRGTWNLLEACRGTGVSRVVVASSDKAYGIHEELPYTEGHALRGTHPYDVSKSCADLISLAYYHTYAMPVCVTRCGNLFGGGDLNFNRLVPGTVRSALRGERPIIRSDGSMIRDYVYVRDIAAAYLLLAEKMDEDRAIAGQAFNFATGQPLSVLQLTNAILRAIGREDLEPVILNEAKAEIPRQYLSAELAQTRLGWKPGHGLVEDLSETIEWYREYLARTGA